MELTAELLLDARDETGEGPVWDGKAQALWWTDIPGKRLHRLDPSSGAHRIFAMPGRVGCFALREAGGLVLAMEQGFATFDPESGAVEILSEPEAGLANHRFNDGRCDPAGRFLAGSMNMAKAAVSGQLWRLDPDKAVTRVAGGVTIANGLAFSPDGKRMYWSDSPAEKVYVFDYDLDTGTPSNQRLFLEKGPAPGRPDGAAVDADGCYWSARWVGNAVVRFTPEGKIDRTIKLPVSRVTMCAFGGPDLRTLYITTACEGMTAEELAAEPLAGGVFVAEPGVQGLPEPSFQG
ncbi:SMP-30/gluconolactonase/LRE family protein [Bosea caraganae]|uniref:SMP-30/gluconolactonase/LRE family protein n=1 Tax=Bosea caraganae TaxID=2763117 RepID=A0A370L027_9HYPH|nr:SMP-30/gluconolactonase/LRE family protein [Bosea caraganae]RDJ20202.1 SMP-30/gluconolactonase/LRE family protein [Bosea caraganae]RDJ21186.1 SMP-30/gluconolactonase/LRE family protein [Bosea caraganae]